jgi:hypothetical protein
LSACLKSPLLLDELLQHDKNEPTIALCDQCVHALKYADARTWKWFLRYISILAARSAIFSDGKSGKRA